MALGAYLAAKEAGREKGLAIVDIDGQREAIAAVRDGQMAAAFAYPSSPPAGSEGIEYAVRILRAQEMRKRVRLPAVCITKKNGTQYYREDSYF